MTVMSDLLFTVNDDEGNEVFFIGKLRPSGYRYGYTGAYICNTTVKVTMLKLEALIKANPKDEDELESALLALEI